VKHPETHVMTAADLAAMLEKWPEGARPTFWTRKYGQTKPMHDGSGFYGIHPAEDVMELEDAIDLACMAGLRWLSSKAIENGSWEARRAIPAIETGSSASAISLMCRDEGTLGTQKLYESEGRYFTGPTLLHAIDAAVRSVAS
jgi:hypothetical protein